jgi:hypothetical protein
MRFNFRLIVAVGILAGIAEAWWSQEQEREAAPEAAGANANAPVLPARAREVKPRPATITAAAPAGITASAKVTQVLTSGAAPADQAQSLLTLFPSLPPATQIEAAHHISNLLPNESYSTWSGYLTNTAAAPEVRNVIYADLMQRPNGIKLPMLLELARAPATGRSPEALALLRHVLGADYGTDWLRWQQGIEARLKSQPD